VRLSSRDVDVQLSQFWRPWKAVRRCLVAHFLWCLLAGYHPVYMISSSMSLLVILWHLESVTDVTDAFIANSIPQNDACPLLLLQIADAPLLFQCSWIIIGLVLYISLACVSRCILGAGWVDIRQTRGTLHLILARTKLERESSASLEATSALVRRWRCRWRRERGGVVSNDARVKRESILRGTRLYREFVTRIERNK